MKKIITIIFLINCIYSYSIEYLQFDNNIVLDVTLKEYNEKKYRYILYKKRKYKIKYINPYLVLCKLKEIPNDNMYLIDLNNKKIKL